MDVDQFVEQLRQRRRLSPHEFRRLRRRRHLMVERAHRRQRLAVLLLQEQEMAAEERFERAA